MKRDMRKVYPRMVLVLLLGLLLVAAPVLTRAQAPGDVVINEFLADPPSDSTGDANGDGVVSSTQDEFIELVNITGQAIDISGWTISVYSTLSTVRHTFPDGTVLPANCGIVVFGGGTPTGRFGGCLVQVASTESLVLTNTGATITLQDSSSVFIDSYTYSGSMAADDQSLTRYPEMTGIFTKHSEVPAAAGALFSPGTLVDGRPFIGCPKLVYLPLVQK